MVDEELYEGRGVNNWTCDACMRERRCKDMDMSSKFQLFGFELNGCVDEWMRVCVDAVPSNGKVLRFT